MDRSGEGFVFYCCCF